MPDRPDGVIPSGEAWRRTSEAVRHFENSYRDPVKFGRRRKRFDGEGGGSKIIRFRICEACCLECWADVVVISKAFSGSIPGSGATVRDCDNTPGTGTGPGEGTGTGNKTLSANQVRVYDVTGAFGASKAFLNEPNDDLLDRIGWAVRATRNAKDCSENTTAQETCGGFSIPDERWEIISLAPPSTQCSP